MAGFRKRVGRAFLALLVAVAALVAGLVTTPAASAASNGGYPWPTADPGVYSPLRFNYRNCTDFAAWKINAQLGVPNGPWKFTWSSLKFPGGNGNADGWRQGAVNSGYRVDGTAKVGSVAWWGDHQDSPIGHVAIVSAVNSDGTVNVEQYNYGTRYQYSTSSHVRADAYLHIADVKSSGGNGVGYGSKFLGTDTLQVGTKLRANQYVMSSGGRYVLKMQTDGNLVEYGPNYQAVWSSKTGGKGDSGSYAVIQTDGNFVVYSGSGKALWATGKKGITKVVVQTDGNVVTRTGSGSPAWASDVTGGRKVTAYGSDTLENGGHLTADHYLRSTDGRYFLLMQTDGNLVLHGPAYHVMWASDTGGRGDSKSYLVVQSDGNVVVYGKGSALWATGKKGAVKLVVQTDGNLVARNSAGDAVWASNTDGRT